MTRKDHQFGESIRRMWKAGQNWDDISRITGLSKRVCQRHLNELYAELLDRGEARQQALREEQARLARYNGKPARKGKD